MRFDGKLEKWNDDRGFGFITPLHGGEPVFVHVSAFPRDGRRPKLGESLTVEVEPAGDGKKRAINIQRAGHRPPAPPEARRSQVGEPRHSGGLPMQRIVSALIIVALGGYAYTQFASYGSRASATAFHARGSGVMGGKAPAQRRRLAPARLSVPRHPAKAVPHRDQFAV
jgi:cold shock CspA family protein